MEEEHVDDDFNLGYFLYLLEFLLSGEEKVVPVVRLFCFFFVRAALVWRCTFNKNANLGVSYEDFRNFIYSFVCL